ncbi:MAG: PEGA domain-containing protein [Deltaproteobacteria bacterium]|jgi:formylglycine-generating enzyme required for sulfatase activity
MLAEDGFPLIIGGGPTADIQISDLKTDAQVAYIGLAQQRPFVQAGQSDVAVAYNHRKLDDSAWLMHEDLLEIGTCKINFRVEGNDFIIQVISRQPASKTDRPPPARGTDTGVKIKPLPFRPQRKFQAGGAIRRHRRLIGLATGLGFLVLVIAAWFVFTARQITIHIEPQPDQISISGSLIAPRIGGHYLLRSGTYTLHAAKECYFPLAQPFEVGADKSQALQFQMERLPGHISVKAHQSGEPAVVLNDARVIIDGQQVGTTPISNLEVKAGRRSLEIQADTYQDIKKEVMIAGCPQAQSFDFALVPGWSDVFVSSIPEGAAVSVDGEPAGNTPLTIELQQGSYQLQIGAEGFKTWQTRLAVAPNQPQSITDIRLQAADGTLALQTEPAGANVTIGEKFVGKTPLNIQLSANMPHEIRISKAGYENVSRRVEVPAEKKKTLAVNLKPIMGVIRFTVKPADAQLVLDGKNQGKVPQELKLIAVSHRLEFIKEGYKPYRTRITPRPGYPQEIKVTLGNLSTKPAGLAAVITTDNGYTLKLIRPGPFTMGSSRREQGRRSNETLRKIALQRPFYMGEREVSNEAFKNFLAGHNSGAFKGQRLSTDNHPVVQVTWEQAALFCNWLSAKASLPAVYVKKGGRLVATEPIGTGYRLPTEAEWEYCARFTKNKADLKYPWGNQFPPTSPSGNYADISAKKLLPAYIENYNDGYPVTAPTAKFKANDLGLYDLGGNVAEWCHDFYTIYPYNTNKADVDPTGPPEGKHHVIKGSSWKYASMSKLRIAYRDYSDAKRPDVGFRVCRYAQ